MALAITHTMVVSIHLSITTLGLETILIIMVIPLFMDLHSMEVTAMETHIMEVITMLLEEIVITGITILTVLEVHIIQGEVQLAEEMSQV